MTTVVWIDKDLKTAFGPRIRFTEFEVDFDDPEAVLRQIYGKRVFRVVLVHSGPRTEIDTQDYQLYQEDWAGFLLSSPYNYEHLPKLKDLKP